MIVAWLVEGAGTICPLIQSQGLTPHANPSATLPRTVIRPTPSITAAYTATKCGQKGGQNCGQEQAPWEHTRTGDASIARTHR